MKPRTGETSLQALRHHLMRGVIERIARTTHDFVLRGGFLTREWVDPLPRPTQDLDFVGDFAFDVGITSAKLAGAFELRLDDGIVIEQVVVPLAMWLDTGFPGVRLAVVVRIEGAEQRIGIDVGFNDPLVPPATTWPNGMRVVRPETQLAWKLHGLVELGDQWRPKDLADLWLIATRVPLEAPVLPAAIEAAFTSRGFTTAQARTALDDPRWSMKTARVRWAGHRGLVLADVIGEVRERLQPALEAL
jgi:hypothetical protein